MSILTFEINQFVDKVVSKSENLILVTASLHVDPLIIRILSEFNKRDFKNIEIIAKHKVSYDVLKNYYPELIKNIHYINEPSVRFSNSIDIFGIFKEKFLLKKIFDNLKYKEKSSIVFFSQDAVYRDFYLLNRLQHKSLNNYIYFIIAVDIIDVDNATTLLDYWRLMIFRFLYGKDLRLVRKSKTRMTRMDNRFLNNIISLELNDDDKVSLNCIPGNKRISIPQSIEIIYFDTPTENHQHLKLKKDILRTVLQIVDNKNKVGIKFHPGFKKDSELLEYGIDLNIDLPSQLLSYKQCRLAISFGSWALSEVSIGKLSGICLIELEYFSDKKFYRAIRDRMDTINENLFYPESIEQFTHLVKKLVKNNHII